MSYRETVTLNTDFLIRECSKYPLLKEDIFYHFRLSNRENIHEVFRYKKFNDDFTDTLTCYNDDNHLIGFIRPNYQEFLRKIALYLNVDRNSKDIEKDLERRLKVLDSIKYEQELRKEFPYLYQDLIDGRKYIANLEKLENESPEMKERLKGQRHYYYACGLRKSLDGFINTQKEVYRRFITQKEQYRNCIKNKSYNSFISKYFDMDIVCLYVMSEYVKKCYESNDKEVINKYLSYLKAYLKSKYNKNVSIVLENNKEFNYDILLNEIKNIEDKLKESSKIIGWEIIPETREYDRLHTGKTRRRRLSLTKEEIDNLREKGNQKQAFYKNTNYLVKVLGLLKYKGYVAYVYPNGEVLLEKEYNDNSPHTALGNAIYLMKARHFDSLSKLDKKELRKKKEVTRIVHSKNWTDRINSIISKEGTEEEQQEAISLVKRFKK